MLSFDFLDPKHTENQKYQKSDSEFLKQLAVFKFFMDVLMKFDIYEQMTQVQEGPGHDKSQYIGQNIPPIVIHMCCSNIRHKTCYKAFSTLDLYLGTCVKKNCTLTNSVLNGDNGHLPPSEDDMKLMMDPNQDPKSLHCSYFKLCINNDLLTNKAKLMELYSILAYRKGIQIRGHNDQSFSSGNRK